MMDESRLLQVFENLIENAIQHSPKDGTVIIETRRSAANGGAWIECSVRDSGAGLKPEDLPRIFEPFFTRRKGGTGLGLSIAQRIVEQHGGEIAAENDPAGGAHFTVRLAVVDRPALGAGQEMI